jgi:hypothetical protein
MEPSNLRVIAGDALKQLTPENTFRAGSFKQLPLEK